MVSAEKNKSIGELGEDLACEFLTGKGYEIIERNYRYGHGEIDIIARHNDVLIFTEVKTRKNLEYGMPEFAITKNKQNQIRRIATAYLYEKGISETDCRMDVVAILFKKSGTPYINHIENAF